MSPQPADRRPPSLTPSHPVPVHLRGYRLITAGQDPSHYRARAVLALMAHLLPGGIRPGRFRLETVEVYQEPNPLDPAETLHDTIVTFSLVRDEFVLTDEQAFYRVYRDTVPAATADVDVTDGRSIDLLYFRFGDVVIELTDYSGPDGELVLTKEQRTAIRTLIGTLSDIHERSR